MSVSVEEGNEETELKTQDFALGFDAVAYLAASKMSLRSAAEAAETMRELEMLNSQLSVEIDRRITDHYADLLGQASALRQTAAAIREIARRATELKAELLKVRTEMLAPYERIRDRTEQLQQLHDSSEVVRCVCGYSQLLKTLREASDCNDIVRAAGALSELTSLLSNPRSSALLSGVRMVDDSRAYVDASANRLRSAAADRMRTGLAQLNQAEIATSLLSFHALSMLDAGSGSALSEIIDSASGNIHSALYGAGNGAAASDAWRRVASALDALGTACNQAWALSKAFTAVKDPATGENLSALTQKFRENSPLHVLWIKLTNHLRNELQSLAKANYVVVSTLAADYPKLLKMFQDFVSRNASMLSTVVGAENQLLSCVKSFESDFVEHARNDLHTMIDQCLSTGVKTASSPAPAAIGGDASFTEVTKALVTRLEGVKNSPRLLELVARSVVVEAIQYLDKQLRALVHTEKDSLQVRDRMNPIQVMNATTFQLAVTAQTSFAQLPAALLWLPDELSRDVGAACNQLDGAAAACVSPLFQSASKLLEGSLYLMHTEDFSLNEPPPLDSSAQQLNSSPYMASFDKALRHFHTQFITRLVPCSTLTSQVSAMCERLLLFFVRNAALIHPLGIFGKAQLTQDMAQLESCISRLQPVQQGSATNALTGYKRMKALRQLIHREPSELVAGSLPPECQELLPSTTLHRMLGLFQDEVPSVRMPWQILHINSIAAYNDWLDHHTEIEAWEKALRPCLEDYAEKANASGQKQFNGLYRQILDVATSLFSSHDTN